MDLKIADIRDKLLVHASNDGIIGQARTSLAYIFELTYKNIAVPHLCNCLSFQHQAFRKGAKLH